jgi:hypothetical protein
MEVSMEVRVAEITLSPEGDSGRWVLTNGWFVAGRLIPGPADQPLAACYGLWAPGGAVEVDGARFLGGRRTLPAVLALADQLAASTAVGRRACPPALPKEPPT